MYLYIFIFFKYFFWVQHSAIVLSVSLEVSSQYLLICIYKTYILVDYFHRRWDKSRSCLHEQMSPQFKQNAWTKIAQCNNTELWNSFIYQCETYER